MHLHRGGENFSPDWQGEFFLTEQQAGQSYDLLLETMQVDQPTNLIFVNGKEIGRLHTRTRPDSTSTWVTQRLSVPARALQPGANTLRVASGLRHPARQYLDWRWENMQFRNVRLVLPLVVSQPLLPDWQALPSPAGWIESNRLRPGLTGDLWLTINRPGQLWRGDGSELQPQSTNHPDLVFVDVLPTPEGELAATDHGLLWRPDGDDRWQEALGAPDAFAYVVTQVGKTFYAGFEGRGLWQAVQLAGPWQPAGLNRRTVHDIASTGVGVLILATDSGVYMRNAETPGVWRRLPRFPTAPAATYRLTTGAQDDWVAHGEHQLWRWDGAAWQPFGPPELTGRLFTVLDCCAQNALVGSSGEGIWQQGPSGWRRLDDGFLDATDIHDLLRVGGSLFAATNLGLFQSHTGQAWRPVPGPPQTISKLLEDPADPRRWLAATSAGVYRSQDRGRTWQLISPIWSVWDLAWGPGGWLFVARSNGVAWADDLGTTRVDWHETAGLNGVVFFSVNPHPKDSGILWAGTWGNNVAVSSDGGRTLTPLHNGLETLSALDVLWHPTPGQVTIATIEGLYRSDDSGKSWFKLPGPLAQQTVHHLMQVDEAIWAGAADGLWVSRDFGATWQRAAGLPVATVLRLGTLDVAGQSWLWAGTEEMGLWLSTDRGKTWQFGGLAGHSVYSLVGDPQRPGQVVAATESGLFNTGVLRNRQVD